MSMLQALLDLGDTEEAVVQTLTDKGVKGTIYYSDACPIANYLTTCGFRLVAVNICEITVGSEAYTPSIAIQFFIQRFDRREFPQLQEK